MKRLKLLILSLLLVLALIPVSIYAEENNTSAPDVSVFATKQQMMDETFRPNENGTANKIGKIVFGKNSSGDPQEWYVLGKDSGVSGDNAVIFATSPIVATGQVFEDAPNNKTDSSLWSDCDYNGVNVTEVYRNHYGASDLRAVLENMAANTSYFTTAEQGLMNDTTVTTKDIFNKDSSNNYLTYTTTDKLYSLTADGYGSSYNAIKAGSDNSTVLAMSRYWSSGTWFWLRSPEINSGGMALVAYPGNHVCEFSVIIGSAVQPASNLNLTNVLFASAAQAGTTDKIEDGTAMTLRLDGAKQEYINEFGTIGTVVYDSTNGIIKATKGSTDKAVTLVVQGKNGDNWCYSQTVSDASVISVDDIMETLSLSDIKLDDCKIWLEISDDNVSYAVQATRASISTISSVDIKEIDAPKANAELDLEAICDKTGITNTKPSVKWNPDNTKADYFTEYTATVELSADITHIFGDTVSATVNGNPATDVTVNSDGTLTVTYTFSPTDKDVLNTIESPEFTYENGTSTDDFIFPDTVTITTKGNNTLSVPVTWDKEALNNYKPSDLNEQILTLKGKVSIPEYIDYTGNETTMTITVKYKIRLTDGDGQTVTITSNKPAVFRSNAEYIDFSRVEVDGNTIEKDKDYTVKEGSIIVTLNPEYLASLSLGEHTIAIVSYKYKDNERYEVRAEGSFTTTKPASTAIIIPNTSVK